MNPAQMEQELQAQKAGAPQPQPAPQQGQQMPQGQPMQDPTAPDQSGSEAMQGLIQHLDSLPEEGKAYVAQYLTPEIAKWAGYVLGSDEVYKYFSELADPNITLIPVPTEVAQQMAQQNSSEGIQQPPMADPEAAPQQMAPQMPPTGNKPPQGTEHM